MSTLSTSTPARAFGLPELTLAGVCVLAAFFAAAVGHLSALALAGVCAFLLGVLVSSLIFGVAGSLVVASALVAFLLMNRFDEGLLITVGSVSFKSSYWLVMLAALGLAAVNVLHRLLGARLDARKLGTSRRFFTFLGLFTVSLLVGLVYNHVYDETVVNRDVVGEVFALISIVAPALFVPLLLSAPMKRHQLVLIVMALVGLAGLGGLVMAAFGFLPESLINALGWASANQGTAGLLRGRLPLGHPNVVAAVLLLLMPLATTLGLMPGGRQFRMIYLGCAVLMFAGVLFSLARSALLVTVVTLGVTTLYVYFGRGRKTLTTYLLPVFFMMALAGVMTYLFLTFDFSRFWSRGYSEDATVDRRQNSMLTSLYVFADYPVLGVSPDAFYTRLELRPGWEPPMQDTISPIFYYKSHMTAESPHNMVLTMLAESGLVGTVLFLGMLWVIFRHLWRLRRHPGLSDEQRHAIMGFMLGLMGFLLMGMFEALFFVGLRPAFLFWAVAGLALRYAHDVAAEADARAAAPVVAG